MHIFSVDKLVFKAVRAYKAGKYQTAEIALNQALKRDQKDFAANLWKVRTLVMLGRYAEGIKAVDAYSNKKLHTKLAELLLKWKTFCLTKVQSNEAEKKELIQMNQETDEMLEKYQHKRDFRLWDIIAVVGLLVIMSFLVGRLIPSAARLPVRSVTYLFIVVYYYAFKAVLPLTIYEAGVYTLKKVTQLYHSSLIRKQIIFIFLMIFFLILHSNGDHITEQVVKSTMLVVDAMFIGPIFEEIVMRGFLYGYLKRYNKWLAWIIVTIAFYAMHTKDAGSWHIILSCICLYVYDCEGTLLAPIMIHILNNVIDISLYIGFKNLM